ncbi:MAG: PorV/PorQ family protein [Bacteroidales bacterium]|nr:PorV/PorQ family protein [Bacteroidales bacterium]
MKHLYKIIIASLVLSLTIMNQAYAGNKDRAGEAGASQLLINPWAQSNGLGGSNSAFVKGLEAQFMNVAGIAHTNKLNLVFSQTQWLKGSGTNISAFGLTTKLGESKGVLALSIVSMGMGDIPVTTVDQPEGTGSFFSPKLMNINLGYAKAFSNSIYGGINIKVISESISNVKSTGIAIDAGIQYVTGRKENLRFGVALKNVGPNMSYSGDGLSIRGFVNQQPNQMTLEQRSALLELPSLIRIGMSYDFYINDDNKITPAYTFTANSFTNDQHAFGIQYAWSKYLELRVGYVYENGILDDTRATALTGPTAGLSLLVPINREGGLISLDYAYQFSNPYQGSHSIGASIKL